LIIIIENSGSEGMAIARKDAIPSGHKRSQRKIKNFAAFA